MIMWFLKRFYVMLCHHLILSSALIFASNDNENTPKVMPTTKIPRNNTNLTTTANIKLTPPKILTTKVSQNNFTEEPFDITSPMDEDFTSITEPSRNNIYEEQLKLHEEQKKLNHDQEQLYKDQQEFLNGFQKNKNNDQSKKGSILPQNVTPYVATVIEWSRSFDDNWSPNHMWKENMKKMKTILDDLQNENPKPDIIVFPEYVLVNSTPIMKSNRNEKPTPSYAIPIPDPDKKIRPCTESDGFEELIPISCSARELKSYVVINVPEIANCTDEHCNGKKVKYYNTNVMFNRDGQVIARYRKVNIYNEFQFDVPETNHEVFIQTDFNRTFGFVTCFDLMFKKPAFDLIYQNNVTDIIYPTNWYSELPFLTAVQYQAAWAFTHNVVLLAADISDPTVGTTGSGIYLGSYGPANISLSLDTESTKVMTSLVPPVELQHPKSNQHAIKGHFLLEDLTAYTSRYLNFTEKEVMQEFCHGKFCCSFSFSTNGKLPSRSYWSVAYHGQRTFESKHKAGIQVCAIIGCDLNSTENEQLTKCPLNSGEEDDLHFETLSITGFFLAENSSQMPNTLTAGYYPLSVDQFRFEQLPKQANRSRSVTMSLIDNDISLITFGIYGRDFSLDVNPLIEIPQNESKLSSGSSKQSPTSIFSILLIISLIKFIFN